MKQINKNLTEAQKDVLFNKGTEPPHTDDNLLDFSEGTYKCANCAAQLFDSSAKYESTASGLVGWPSFDSALVGALEYKQDKSLFMKRTEVVCKNCGGHLGHVFAADDAPSGTHFCINSLSIDFDKAKKED